ncbi:glycoside hydrolase family 2 protein [Seonamhaeicola marinus]|uniref:Beta-galactosidase n=1 Tax=Seonamhaeicola marinus TaxID=1912246 RepID=A0A5D0J1Y3_9FLAO|nr:glycoside hydrolase family 2 TIM barrel-domain containing protein [Seonamhaeicola marinus]TYA89228.1 hypothetical protein FUA24_03590 [Seonamhaeicola marinus]
MKIYKSKIALLVIFLTILGTFNIANAFNTNPISNNARIIKSLNGPWKFYQGEHHHADKELFDDSRWLGVNVPHTWNTDITQGIGYYKGEAWYRKSFNVSKSISGKRLFIRFNGVLTSATVYINGKELGTHHGGYAAFVYEITDVVNYGLSNQISVKVDNADNKNVTPVMDKLFTRFGGIYRPVNLIITDKTCITPLDYASSGVYLKQENITKKKAEVNIVTKLDNEDATIKTVQVKAVVKDFDGKVVWKSSDERPLKIGENVFNKKMVLKDPHLWNGKKDPYLYSVTISVVKNNKLVDEIEQPLGLRYYKVDANEGFFLNGEYVDLQGVCRHQEWKQTGSALSEEQHRRDMELIEEIGANTIRFAHYQQADIMYEQADKNGIVVWAEVPITPPYQKNNDAYKANCKLQIMELMRQNYNHPSILFWGMYNEVNISAEDVAMFQELMKAEDPTRLTTAASHKPLAKRHELTDLIAWNRYYAWYHSPDNGIGKWFDDIHEKKPELKLAVSEYGAGGSIAHQRQEITKANPIDGQFYPEQYQCYVHEVNYDEINKRKYLWGKYLWNMFDFSWPIVNRGDDELLNHKGLVTYDREVKKDIFFFYKANWSNEPVIYLTSRRHIFRDNPVTSVKVYSNASDLKLTVNGTVVNKNYAVKNRAYVWEGIQLIKGENKIEVSGNYNNKEISDSCVWVY